jgi:phage terminase large subunit-like protein
MGNRGKLAQLLAVTTAGQKTDMTGQDSIAYNLYQTGKRVATGEITDPTFLWLGGKQQPEADHRLESTWESANPGFNDLVAARMTLPQQSLEPQSQSLELSD